MCFSHNVRSSRRFVLHKSSFLKKSRSAKGVFLNKVRSAKGALCKKLRFSRRCALQKSSFCTNVRSSGSLPLAGRVGEGVAKCAPDVIDLRRIVARLSRKFTWCFIAVRLGNTTPSPTLPARGREPDRVIKSYCGRLSRTGFPPVAPRPLNSRRPKSRAIKSRPPKSRPRAPRRRIRHPDCALRGRVFR